MELFQEDLHKDHLQDSPPSHRQRALPAQRTLAPIKLIVEEIKVRTCQAATSSHTPPPHPQGIAYRLTLVLRSQGGRSSRAPPAKCEQAHRTKL